MRTEKVVERGAAHGKARGTRRPSGKPRLFSRAKHMPLRAKWIDPYAKHRHNGGSSYDYQPSAMVAQKPHKLDDGADEGNRRHRNDEEVKRRIKSHVVRKALLFAGHNSPFFIGFLKVDVAN